MKKCDIQGCRDDSGFIDGGDNYLCSQHMDEEIEYGDTVAEDYESLDWGKCPKNGYSE